MKVYNVIKKLLEMWQTKYIRNERGKMGTTRKINIRRGFLQGDSFSPVGFCLTEVPIGMMLEEAAGYKKGGGGGERDCKRTLILFIDDLKVYSSGHQKMQIVNETITRASSDVGAAYGVKKCAKIVIERGVMVRGDGLDVLEERMKCLDLGKAEIYKFLGYEQSDALKKAVPLGRVKQDMISWLNRVLETRLIVSDKAINTHILRVAA